MLPLRSLLEDYKQKLCRWGVRYTYYDTINNSTVLDPKARLILVTTDQSRSPLFKMATTLYELQVKIMRICVDEAHRGLLDADYRPVLRRFYDLRWRKDQTMMLMSGSAPPDMLPHLAHAFGLTDTPDLYHEPFHNPNLFYDIEYVKSSEDIVKSCQQLEDDYKTFLLPSDADQADLDRNRYLFFVPSIAFGKRLSEALNCGFFHSARLNAKDAKDPEVRKGIQMELADVITRWQSEASPSKSMVASSAYSEGNDNAFVKAVIHANTPAGMLPFHQESNRSGRRIGMKALCKIFALSQCIYLGENELDFKGTLAMDDLLWNNRTCCVRFAITFKMDGRGAICLQGIDILCCRCRQIRQLDLSEGECVRRLKDITVRDL